ncbi:GNAT family N-acetyltransferase [Kitasatospora sp. NPDC006697]|uniref:GNAT family N-acetyltransferase n=1 Tax=Kitasatospora sp. NPDC006697 TaxID=3364020 RepID=UPI00369CF42E
MIDLRELALGDTEAVLQVYSAESTKYLGRAPMDTAEASSYTRTAVSSAAESPRTVHVLGLVVDSDLVGVVKLHRDRPVAALSYIVRAAAWGRGYATEGVRKVLDLAFGHLALPEVRARHHPDNPASGRVLLKAGFVSLGERAGFLTYTIRPPWAAGPVPHVSPAQSPSWPGPARATRRNGSSCCGPTSGGSGSSSSSWGATSI